MKLRLAIEEEVGMCDADEFEGVMKDMEQELEAEGIIAFLVANFGAEAKPKLTTVKGR